MFERAVDPTPSNLAYAGMTHCFSQIGIASTGLVYEPRDIDNRLAAVANLHAVREDLYHRSGGVLVEILMNQGAREELS